MTRRAMVVLIIGMVVALAIAALGGAVVLAQTGTATPQAPGAATQQAKPNLAQDFWQALADKLGISVDTLRQDVNDAVKSAADKAVTDGRLSQSQADAIKQRADQAQSNGQFGFFGRGFGRGHPGGPGFFGFGKMGALASMNQDMLSAAANALKMNVSDLMTEFRSGKSLATVAQEKGVDQAAVKKAMVDAGKADVQKAVVGGQLTQQQADQINSRLDQLDLNNLMEHGFGPSRGKWGGAPRQLQPQATPTGPTL